MKENKKNSFMFSLMTFLLPISSPSSSPNSQMFLLSIPHIFSYFVSSVHDNERWKPSVTPQLCSELLIAGQVH